MRYRDFGKTGIKISALGFGCMRLPMIKINGEDAVDIDRAIDILHKAYEQGVNYFDSAYIYNNGLSEGALGKALKGIRDKVYVSTKSPGHILEKPGDYTRILEEQLKRLDIDYIDFYHFHGIGYDNFFETDKNTNWLSEAQKAKEQGIIKHISFSFHDKPESMIKLIDTGLFESVLCQYNAVDRSNEEAIAYAKSKGLGVAVMGPLGGGRVSGMPKDLAGKLGITVKSNAELALRFVLANKNIDCALSGMENLQMVEENTATASNSDPLSDIELKAINDMMEENAKLAQLYCTGCSYCMPCPSGVNIPQIFKLMNYYKIYGIEEHSK
ncbi:MAG TPA: aldo/keto reductase, partial [Clostridia bacterium]|nr:aldo/keto reductase [Clostridia bacterium]